MPSEVTPQSEGSLPRRLLLGGSAVVGVAGLSQLLASPADAATGVTASGASLNGNVNPNGVATSYHFEYGLTDAYGARSPAVDAVLGAPTAPTPVSVSTP